MAEKPLRRIATCDAEREICHHAEQASEDAAAAVIENYSASHANAEQLKALQDWVQEVRRAAEGPENAPIEPAAVQYSAGKQPIHRKDMP